MKIKDALQIVFELAEQNVLHDDVPMGMMAEKERQQEAVDQVRQLLVNDTAMSVLSGWDE